MKRNKLDLIDKAAALAVHKRSSNEKKLKSITTEAISFKVGDTKEILESFINNSRSKAMREAIHYANDAGILNKYKD